MNCEEAKKDFSALLDGELTPPERERVEAHLSQCADCLRELDTFKRVDLLYRALPEQSAPQGFEERVRRAVKPSVIHLATARLRRRPVWPLLAAAATFLLLMGGVLFKLGVGQQRFEMASAPPPAPAMASAEKASPASPQRQAQMEQEKTILAKRVQDQAAAPEKSLMAQADEPEVQTPKMLGGSTQESDSDGSAEAGAAAADGVEKESLKVAQAKPETGDFEAKQAAPHSPQELPPAPKPAAAEPVPVMPPREAVAVSAPSASPPNPPSPPAPRQMELAEKAAGSEAPQREQDSLNVAMAMPAPKKEKTEPPVAAGKGLLAAPENAIAAQPAPDVVEQSTVSGNAAQQNIAAQEGIRSAGRTTSTQLGKAGETPGGEISGAETLGGEMPRAQASPSLPMEFGSDDRGAIATPSLGARLTLHSGSSLDRSSSERAEAPRLVDRTLEPERSGPPMPSAPVSAGLSMGSRYDAAKDEAKVGTRNRVGTREFVLRDDGWYEQGYAGETCKELTRDSEGAAELAKANPELEDVFKLEKQVTFRVEKTWYKLLPPRADH